MTLLLIYGTAHHALPALGRPPWSHCAGPARISPPATPLAAPLVQVNECTAELKANLQEEHLAGMEFIGTVFKTILSPLQKARAIVQSYPFYPDVYQVGAVAVAATAAVVGH